MGRCRPGRTEPMAGGWPSGPRSTTLSSPKPGQPGAGAAFRRLSSGGYSIGLADLAEPRSIVRIVPDIVPTACVFGSGFATSPALPMKSWAMGLRSSRLQAAERSESIPAGHGTPHVSVQSGTVVQMAFA